MKLNQLALSIAVLLTWMSCPAQSEVVFDNISGSTLFEGGIVTDPGYQGGNIVQLVGTSRIATQLDVLLERQGLIGGTGEFTFRVNLWNPSSAGNDPGTLIWTSPEQHVTVLNRIPTAFSVMVPNVRVPDTLGWTVEGIVNRATVVSSFPGGVGTVVGRMLYSPVARPDSRWSISRNPTSNGLGFRLFAVPEPATLALVVVGVAWLLHVRRSR
jgi:hypothetical protein